MNGTDQVSKEREHGSPVVSLTSGARGPGFDPCSWQGKILVSVHAFFSVIYRDDTK